jgi:hypothetical protein
VIREAIDREILEKSGALGLLRDLECNLPIDRFLGIHMDDHRDEIDGVSHLIGRVASFVMESSDTYTGRYVERKVKTSMAVAANIFGYIQVWGNGKMADLTEEEWKADPSLLESAVMKAYLNPLRSRNK